MTTKTIEQLSEELGVTSSNNVDIKDLLKKLTIDKALRKILIKTLDN